MSEPTTITYLFDPFCGWCYGAMPALSALSGRPGITVEMAPTGLFSGDGARPIDEGFAAFAWSNDQRIARITGQRFSDAYREKILGERSRRFDSGPASLALTAVSLEAPDRELQILQAFQTARYEDGRDTADPTVLAAVLVEMGLPSVAARIAAPDEALLAAHRDRVAAARAAMRRVRAEGVPTVIAETPSGRRVIPSAVLYGDADGLLAELGA
ncbi:DsbA family protein [Chthonobacter rhizosphaerae]|uniref:DsbA family protein n=1 Tax=Chthonobacter rhizosphaerae TaxID=2735553 RepID=UPI0015EE9B74|nr:DsbA family protein [Chthonobacter rhizosphaerae]